MRDRKKDEESMKFSFPMGKQKWYYNDKENGKAKMNKGAQA